MSMNKTASDFDAVIEFGQDFEEGCAHHFHNLLYQF